ncbi:MAG: hypothetical protein MRERV_32c005 [Mycoplasmataceae bacterium RV_VA103A]|nr:MAG: hypothetical protein MRERV_32c005 [Mycoplasmataceae bacterium RV_VA103A]
MVKMMVEAKQEKIKTLGKFSYGSRKKVKNWGFLN